MNKRKRCLSITFLLVIVTLGQWSCSEFGEPRAAVRPPEAEPELVLQAVEVQPRDWVITVPISGELRSRSVVEIKAEVVGRLIAAYFEEGDLVAEGELLAEIDASNYELARDQAVAALAVAEAGLARYHVVLDHAKREKDRADNLLRTGGITEKEHEAALTSVREAESQVRLAEAQCRQARAAIAITEKSLRDCRLSAPADGRVQRKFFDEGSLLAAGSPVYSLVDNARLELECDLPSYQLAGIRLGQKAVFTTPTWGEQSFTGVLSAINPVVEPDSRTVKIKLKISNPGEKLRSGMFATGAIEVGREEEALVVPRSALVGEEGPDKSGSVYTVEDGRARLRDVQVGGSRRDLLWIKEGLKPKDKVIVEVGPTLKDGSVVRMTNNQNVNGR